MKVMSANVKFYILTGMVSVAGATGNLWAVESGNFKVPLGLLEYSGAQLIGKNVLKVGLESNGKLKLTIDDDGVKQIVPQVVLNYRNECHRLQSNLL